jgi:hypothetical protein
MSFSDLSDFDYSDGIGLSDDDNNYLSTITDDNVEDPISEALSMAQAMLNSSMKIARKGTSIVASIPVINIDMVTRQASGLMLEDPIVVRLVVENGTSRNSPIPEIIVEQGDQDNTELGIYLCTTSKRVNGEFPIGLQICQAVCKFLMDAWCQPRTDTFLVNVFQLALDRLRAPGTNCQLCDKELEYPGLKPTICESNPLCSYQLENLGLGVDLSLLDTDPKTADLLISITTAACFNSQREKFALPNRPVRGSSGEAMTARELGDLLQSLPATEYLAGVGPKHRNDVLDGIDPLASFVLRWVFATNRAHIVSLPPYQHIEDMVTPFQYRINTSTRKHADKFERLKELHGSFYAFHGSWLGNWHNILRQNLKNASNTPMMQTGNAYGDGVYLAEASNASALYCVRSQGWRSSEFGQSVCCLALCEVANSNRVHRHPGSIIVASDEDCVMLRYLFLYASQEIPTVNASQLKLRIYHNETTIAYGSTFEEVRKTARLLITSDEYFWDMDEVVAMIKGRNGLFINGYTQKPFAPCDVDAIINHSSGLGKELQKIEEQNRELRTQISRTTVVELNRVGIICRNDHSEEFGPSLEAISGLRTWLTKVSAAERKALQVAPFDATDTHTRQLFRDTVMHAIELVSSGGDCVHRFGDFLSQLHL